MIFDRMKNIAYILFIVILFTTCSKDTLKGIYQHTIEHQVKSGNALDLETFSVEQFIFLKDKTFIYQRYIYTTDTINRKNHGTYQRINNSIILTYNGYKFKNPSETKCHILTSKETTNDDVNFSNIKVAVVDKYKEEMIGFNLQNKNNTIVTIGNFNSIASLNVHKSEFPLKLYINYIGLQTCFLEFKDPTKNYTCLVELQDSDASLEIPYVEPYPYADGSFTILIEKDSFKINNRIWKKIKP